VARANFDRKKHDVMADGIAAASVADWQRAEV
jgi:hypothetical protein